MTNKENPPARPTLLTPKRPIHGGLDGAEKLRLKPPPEPKKDDKKK